jgi:hypothetical protein
MSCYELGCAYEGCDCEVMECCTIPDIPYNTYCQQVSAGYWCFAGCCGICVVACAFTIGLGPAAAATCFLGCGGGPCEWCAEACAGDSICQIYGTGS